MFIAVSYRGLVSSIKFTKHSTMIRRREDESEIAAL